MGIKAKKPAFSLIELILAIVIFGMVIAFASIIFKVSIKSYRTGIANAEIMRKLRAITDQLNLDFAGVNKDMPLIIWPDRVAFLATGDFQSIQQYPYKDHKGNILSKTIKGNLASIFYGITDVVIGKDESGNDVLGEPILSRGQMILTSDGFLLTSPNPTELGEYCQMSFYELKNNITGIFGSKKAWAGKDLPPLNIDSEQDLVRYMIKGIKDFKIEYEFGLEDTKQNTKKIRWLSGNGISLNTSRALKFTFRLYDSRGVLENGRQFTHIVYINN